ncbi:PKD domain-containing protein [Anseongella ginsenosidimutans]|uniref:PKD domain-containing protein n=1 Tax=Anseongella ginsenosidimutans TaxID=496056 RepID=A0A4R3KUG0_9SPHI|nr:PKD domain-containing protein [Anseongella ginsenosidimutans]QEC53549.1 PKD domain-containing protein [Anseongella ginsenosidimutans]TCS88453.1 PKD domain-containing protein [Anseongella ginsenosidimutans]
MKRPLLLAVSILSAQLFHSGCEKKEVITIEQPNACFTVHINRDGHLISDQPPSNFPDSAFYFKNCSDSSDAITYLWNFGDGSTSTERNPIHRYPQKGKYDVSLIVNKNNGAFDTAHAVVLVAIGQKNISLGTDYHTRPVDIAPTGEDTFLLLGESDRAGTYDDLPSCFLMEIDSELNWKKTKTFPTSTRFNSMLQASDGNYILTGTTGGRERFNELAKMTEKGNLLWTKPITADDHFFYAKQTSDGGYLVTGTRAIPQSNGYDRPYALIVKTDPNGNKQWEKVLNTAEVEIGESGSIIADEDGIVVAGIKMSVATETGYCYYCDSVMIAKYTNAGELLWKNTVGLGIHHMGGTRLSRIPGGNYIITNGRALFFFSPSGIFENRKLLDYATEVNMVTTDNKILLLQSRYSNGYNTNILKLDQNGLFQWDSFFNGSRRLENGGASCCSSTYPVAAHPMKNGGNILLGRRTDAREDNSGYYDSIILLQLDNEGNPL